MEERNLKFLRLYSNFFNRSYLFDFINKKNNRIKNILLASADNSSVFNSNMFGSYSDMFEYTYSMLCNYYKCEYVYLNKFFINEILKNHDDNHTVLTELYVNDSQADLVVINGTSTVYEIKTELDTLIRLKKQLEDYTRTFDKVYVITNKIYLKQVKSTLKEKFGSVGICLLDENGCLKTIRKSKSHKSKLDKELMFNVLNRKEFEKIDEDYYKAKAKFLKMSVKAAHEFYKNALFNRAKDMNYLTNFPDSLKLAIYKIQNKLTQEDRRVLLEKIRTNILEE